MTITDTEEVGFRAVPVELTDRDRDLIASGAEFTPVYGTWQTYQLQGLAGETQPQPLLPADPKRRRAFIQVNPQVGSPQANEGSVTSPGANVVIAQITVANLAPGWYQVQWAVDLDGTVGAGDANNFILKGPGLGGGVTSENNGAAGHYVQNTIQIYVPFGNATVLAVRSILAGTVGAIYSAQISITPLIFPGGFILVGTIGQISNGGGGKIFGGNPRWEIRNHAKLYFAGDGVTALVMTVLVERDQIE